MPFPATRQSSTPPADDQSRGPSPFAGVEDAQRPAKPPGPSYRIVVSLTGNRQIIIPRTYDSWADASKAHDVIVNEFDDTNMIRWEFHEERSAVAINGDQVVCIKITERGTERHPRVREARA